MSEEITNEDLAEVDQPKRGRRSKAQSKESEAEHPAHAARLKEKSQREEYESLKKVEHVCFFLEGSKLKRAKFDKSGSMKTEFILDVTKKKNKASFEQIKGILKKVTGQPLGYMENRLLLDEKEILAKYLIPADKVLF